MQRFFLDIEKLHIGDAAPHAPATYVFLAQPTPLEEQALGRLFLLVSITSNSDHTTEVIRIIRDEMREQYYHTEELEMAGAFEEALNRLNRKLHGLIREGAADWLADFSAVIGVLRGQKILFTHRGRVELFLIFGRRMMDVLGSAEPDEPMNPLKIFSSIVEGDITEGSSLLVSTSTLLDYFSREKLRQLVTGRPTHEAMAALEQLLREHQHDAQFGVITARLIPAHDNVPSYRVPTAEPQHRAHAVADDSMEELISREEKTGELLAPSLFAEVGKRGSKAFTDFSSFWRTKVQRKPQRRTPYGIMARSGIARPGAQSYREERPHFFLAFVGMIERGIRALFRGSVRAVRNFRREKPLRERALELPQETEGFISRLIIRFQKLTFRRKLILIIGIVALVVFAESIVILGQRSRNAEDIERVAVVFTQVEENLLDAETSLSFGDREGAQRVLLENKTLLTDAPVSRKQDRERSDNLMKQNEELLNETRNIHTIDTLIVKADLTTVNAEATGSTLTALNGSLFSINPTTKAVYRIGTDALTLDVIAPPDGFEGSVKRSAADDALLYVMNDANALVAYDPEANAWQTRTIPLPSGEHGIAGMAFFLDRLYLLDSVQNQIFRFPKTTNGFGASFSWIRDEVPALAGAVDIDIDGTVYVTFGDGTIQRYVQGVRESFTLAAVDPVLTSATALWTTEGSDNLYIFDAASRRIIQFGKDGHFNAQYQFAGDITPTAFSIDETNKRGFVLTGTTIGEFSLGE